MKKTSLILITVVVIGILVAIPYLAKLKNEKVMTQGQAQEGEKKASYWTCGMHPQIRRDAPGNCPICNMPLIPVYEQEERPQDPPAAHQMAPAPSAVAVEQKISAESQSEKKVYMGCGVEAEGHCPHCDKGIADAKCICGGHSFVEEGKVVKLCPICKKSLKVLTEEQVQQMKAKSESNILSRVKLTSRQKELGDIKTETLSRRHLSKTIRTVGEVAYDPELYVAEEEYLTALETTQKVAGSSDPDVLRRAEDLLERSRSKLFLLGLNEILIDELEKAGKPDQSLTLPKEQMWVYASIYEYEIGWIKTGMPTTIITTAFPGEEFKGVIQSINPVLDEKTRSIPVRIRVDNPDMKLRPKMYADVTIESMFMLEGEHEVLAVPEEAVLDTGTRKIVYVEAQPGEYLGKEVRLGPQAESRAEEGLRKFYPVLEGLQDGDAIVTRGNFLIDSQSQLSGNMSVLWGGAQEFKTEAPAGTEEPAAVQTQHKH